VQTLGLPAPLLDHRPAVTGQVPLLTGRAIGHETRPDQAVLQQLRSPLGVRHVGLAARHVTHVTGVDHPHVPDGLLQHPMVGSDQGAAPTFRPVRFPGPPAEPDVRLSPHSALHHLVSLNYAASIVCAQRVAMFGR
jgi:hypothetical protein